MTTVQELITALEKKEIEYEFKDIKRWTGEFDEEGIRVMEATGSYQISFEYEEHIWAHFKVIPLYSENKEPNFAEEPVFFMERYNNKIGKSMKSLGTGYRILKKILN